MLHHNNHSPDQWSALTGKPTRIYPRMHVDTAPCNAVGQAGDMLLPETVHTSGLGHHMKRALAAW